MTCGEEGVQTAKIQGSAGVSPIIHGPLSDQRGSLMEGLDCFTREHFFAKTQSERGILCDLEILSQRGRTRSCLEKVGFSIEHRG